MPWKQVDGRWMRVDTHDGRKEHSYSSSSCAGNNAGDQRTRPPTIMMSLSSPGTLLHSPASFSPSSTPKRSHNRRNNNDALPSIVPSEASSSSEEEEREEEEETKQMEETDESEHIVPDIDHCTKDLAYLPTAAIIAPVTSNNDTPKEITDSTLAWGALAALLGSPAPLPAVGSKKKSSAMKKERLMDLWQDYGEGEVGCDLLPELE